MKLRKPEFDQELVLAIEEHLGQGPLTQIIDVVPMADGLATMYSAGEEYADFSRPMFEVIADPIHRAGWPADERPAAPSCPMCMDFSRSWTCAEHQAQVLIYEAAEKAKRDRMEAEQQRIMQRFLVPFAGELKELL